MTEHRDAASEPHDAVMPNATTEGKPPSSGGRELGAAVLAVLFYALLVDVAVETFLNAAPVRWWVGGIVAAFFGLTALVLWRGGRLRDRFGWSSRATAAFFVLLGLLAATVWLPEGLTNGVAALRQSTSVLLSAVSALAIAFAGVVFARARFVPLWGRAALVVLALYGATAFVLGILDGSSYSALLRGESLWQRLPFWLQGAFLGALVAVPLAVVTSAVGVLKRLRAADGRSWGLQQSVALGLAVLMAVSGVTIQTGSVAGVGVTSVAGPQLSAGEITKPLDDTYRELSRVMAGSNNGQPRSPQQAAGQLEKLFPALEAAAKAIPRDTFDMAAVVEKVGRDPIKLFEWVRDETYLVPYRGLLRGHTGVLMDRLGNSLDRAVLLYAMLGSIGQTVRLARGTLTDQQARTLLENARPVPAAGVPALSAASADPAQAVLDNHAREQRLDPAALRQAIDKIALEQTRVKEAVQNRVAQQTAMIVAAIGKPDRNEEEEHAQRVASVRDHWWVELQNGSSWTPLDPSLPDSAPGATLSSASATVAPGHFRDLGADQLHWIKLRVIVETWNRGQVSEAAVLERDLLPAELIGKSIVLRFVPVAWPRELNLFEEKDVSGKLRETVLAQREWLPILQIDGQTIARYTFNDYGDFGDITLPGYAQAALAGRILVHKTEEAVEAMGNRVGGMLSGPKEKPAVAAPPPSRKHVTAVWIDYELHAPEQAARTVRRDILDVLGPAARTIKPTPAPNMMEFEKLERGLALMGETDILPLVGQLTPQFTNHIVAAHLVANRNVLSEALRGNPADLQATKERVATVKRLPTELYTLALARQQWSESRANVYLDRPNILSHHRRGRYDAQGMLSILHGFDIVTNDVAVRPVAGLGPFLVRLQQGVLDTNAEAVLAQMSTVGPARVGDGDVQNTSERFSTDAGVSASWMTLKDTGEPGWQTLKLSPDVRARIEKDLSAGYAVLVAERPQAQRGKAFLSWWRVDPRTGGTLGIGERGWGQTTFEKFKIVSGVTVTTVASVFCVTSDRYSDCPREIQGGLCMLGGMFCYFAAIGVLTTLWGGWVGMAGILKFFVAICATLSGVGGTLGDVAETFKWSCDPPEYQGPVKE